jgi:hypothetical protein
MVSREAGNFGDPKAGINDDNSPTPRNVSVIHLHWMNRSSSDTKQRSCGDYKSPLQPLNAKCVLLVHESCKAHLSGSAR